MAVKLGAEAIWYSFSDVLVQPGQHVGIHLALVDLVEHLMPPAGVELHGEVAGAVGLEVAVHRPDSRPVGPHRVLIPGEQVHMA